MNFKRLAISLLVGAALAAASAVWARNFPTGLLRVQGGVPVPLRSLETDIHIHDTYYVVGWPLIANFAAFTTIALFALSRWRRSGHAV